MPTFSEAHTTTGLVNRWWVGLILYGTYHSEHVLLRQMASYQEVATEDVRKSICRLLEAETKLLITDLLRTKWGAYQDERSRQYRNS